MKRILMVTSLAALAIVGFAKPTYNKVFAKTYTIDSSSALGKASCSVCHVHKSVKLNPYGLDQKRAMSEAKTKVLTTEILHKLDSLDSTKTGSKNIDKIKAGKNPGVD